MTTGPGPIPAPQAAYDDPLPPPAPLGEGVEVLRGVAYADLEGSRPLELDVYLPQPTAEGVRRPAVVFVHGGGWRLGSRRRVGPAYAGAQPLVQLAAAGFVVVSVDYRLSGEAVWPAQLHDVSAAVRWVRYRSADLGVDVERIGIWGESAGAHLALLTALVPSDASVRGGLRAPAAQDDGTVTSVVAWYAPSDLRRLPDDLGTDPADPASREAQLMGAPLSDEQDRTAEASPVTYVTGAAPPVLLLHGLDDILVPSAQSERLHQALMACGATVDLHLYPEVGHLWLPGAGEGTGHGSASVPSDAMTRTIAFFRRTLG